MALNNYQKKKVYSLSFNIHFGNRVLKVLLNVYLNLVSSISRLSQLLLQLQLLTMLISGLNQQPKL